MKQHKNEIDRMNTRRMEEEKLSNLKYSIKHLTLLKKRTIYWQHNKRLDKKHQA